MDIARDYELPFPPEQIFDTWTSSSTVIEPATAMEVNAVAGGYNRLIIDTPEFASRNEGRFIRVERPQHLQYTWEWNGDGDVSEVTVLITATPAGSAISLRHTGLPDQASADAHTQGWDSYIEGLRALLMSKSL